MNDEIVSVGYGEDIITAEELVDPDFIKNLVEAGRIPRFYMTCLGRDGWFVDCYIPREKCNFGEEIKSPTKPYYSQRLEDGNVVLFEEISLEFEVGEKVRDLAYNLVEQNEAAMSDCGYQFWLSQREMS